MPCTSASAAAWAFRHLHNALCTDAGRLQAAVGTWSPDDRRSRGQIDAAVRWWREYCGLLTAHHRVEQQVWFPVLAARGAEIEAGDLADMTGDHRYLDALAAKVEAALARLATRNAPFEAARRDVVTAVAALANLLADHVRQEDRTFVALIEQVLAPGEVDTLCEQTARELTAGEARFLVPWFFAHLPAAERAAQLRRADPATRELHRLAGPGYHRLALAAGMAG